MNEMTKDREKIELELGEPGPERIWYVGDAFAMGMSVDEVHQLTRIDPWFLVQIKEIVDIELKLERIEAVGPRSHGAVRAEAHAASRIAASRT